jgi:DTW domain-containing protein
MTPRPLCPDCLRPARACLCDCVRKVHSPVQWLVLQHPMEVGHAKNTARLLHLCLPGSRLEVGELFDPAALQQWLHTPWQGQAKDVPVHTVLLYPPTPADPQLPVVQPPELPKTWLEQTAQLRVVLIDGTWRKSRKMLYVNPALQQLPRLALRDVPPGRYAIRKAHAPGQLSSFEAGALALAQLQDWDDDHPHWLALAHSFDAAIRQHQSLQREGNP